MPGSGLCRACCHVLLATVGPYRIVGMASSVLSGEVLSAFYFSVRADFWETGLKMELLSRLEAWGGARRAREAQWPAQMFGDPRDGVYAKSLETKPAAARKDRSPAAWEKIGVCIQELELERPEIVFDDRDRPIGEGLRRSDGSPRGIVLPFGGGFFGSGGSPGDDGLPVGGGLLGGSGLLGSGVSLGSGVPPGGDGSPVGDGSLGSGGIFAS